MITFSMGQVEPSDEEFQVDSDDSVEDDEETIDQAEKEDADDGGESHANELKQLEAEMDMPLDKLLAKYNQPAAGHDQPAAPGHETHETGRRPRFGRGKAAVCT